MNRIDEKYIRRIFSQNFKTDAKILDIGCGVGENLGLLRGLGFSNVIGVDISRHMVECSNKLGYKAFLPEELIENEFDVLLFSHVIEHLGYPEIVHFLEYYFSKAKKISHIVIVTPTLHEAFFNDIDHIKPYFPDGLVMLFSESKISKQYSSNFSLTLEDVYFRKESLIPYHLRCKYSKLLFDKLFFKLLSKFYIFLKLITFGILSKVTGYSALFKLTKQT